MKTWLSAIFLILVPTLSPALPNSSAFGVEQGSLEWKRAELEEWLVSRASEDVGAFIKSDKFKIQMHVTFRDLSARRAVTNVNVPLLGTVATLDNPDKPNPQLGLFEKVARLDITLIVADNMSEETAQSMVRLIKRSVPVIKPQKIFSEIVRLDPPSLGFLGWIREFKSTIALIFLLSLFLLGMRYILPQIRFQTAIKFGPAQPPAVPRTEVMPFSKLHIPMMVPLEVMSDDEQPNNHVKPTQPSEPGAGEELLDSLLPSTLATVELRRLRSLAMTLSISECIELVLSDLGLGSILVNLLPTEKTTSILAQLPEYVLQDLKNKTLDWSADSLALDSAALMTAIQEFKGVPKPVGTEKLRVFVDQVGAENEEKVFSELVRMEKFDQLAQLSRQSPPAELIPEFPFEILFAVFERMGFREKAGVLFTCDKNLGEQLCPQKSKNPVHMSLRQEVERVQKDKAARQKAGFAWSRFVSMVREALQRNPRWQQSVKPLIEHWLWQKSHGVVGRERPKSKGRKGDNAA